MDFEAKNLQLLNSAANIGRLRNFSMDSGIISV